MARARRAAAGRELESGSPEQGHVAEGADRVRADERPRALRARRADDGLDPVNVRLVQDLLLERRRGRTTILSTHQMNQVEALCDRVALINKGRLVVYGAVDDVRRPFLAGSSCARARRRCRPCREVAGAIAEGDGSWRLMLADGASPADALAALVQAGARSTGSSRCSRRWRTFSCAWSGRRPHEGGTRSARWRASSS